MSLGAVQIEHQLYWDKIWISKSEHQKWKAFIVCSIVRFWPQKDFQLQLGRFGIKQFRLWILSKKDLSTHDSSSSCVLTWMHTIICFFFTKMFNDFDEEMYLSLEMSSNYFLRSMVRWIFCLAGWWGMDHVPCLFGWHFLAAE